MVVVFFWLGDPWQTNFFFGEFLVDSVLAFRGAENFRLFLAPPLLLLTIFAETHPCLPCFFFFFPPLDYANLPC